MGFYWQLLKRVSSSSTDHENVSNCSTDILWDTLLEHDSDTVFVDIKFAIN